MKRFLATALAIISSFAFGATLTPISLLNPATSTAGQAIVSNGPNTAPSWQGISFSSLTGIVPLANGGTGANSASAARTALGLGSAATVNTGTSGATVPLLNGANTWAAAQTFSVRPTFNGATPYDSSNLSFTAPPAIGGTTPASGAFTTLSASGNDALSYSNTSTQSIPNNALTTITNWTKVSDRVNANFNATTGVFTAPATGMYQVSGAVSYAAAAGVVGTVVQVHVIANSVDVSQGEVLVPTTTTLAHEVQIPTVTVSLAAGQTVVVQAYQNSGAARNLANTASRTFVSINRIP